MTQTNLRRVDFDENTRDFGYNADYPNYHLFDKTRCEILHQYLNGLEEQIDNLSKGISENKSISIGIVNGITGIGIIDLCYPEVMSVNSNK